MIRGIVLLKSQSNQYLMIYYLMLLASVAVYSLIEVQERYVYLQEFMLIVTAAIGVEGLFKKIKVIHKT